MLRISSSVLAFVALLLPASSQATTFIMMTQEQVIQSSKAICFGEITDVSSAQIPQRNRVKTIATFKIQECLKGSLSGSIKISAPGGSMKISENGQEKTVTQRVIGAPHLEKGWIGVVHLSWREDKVPQEFQVTSWQRGMMQMTYDKELKDFREGGPQSQTQVSEKPVAPEKRLKRVSEGSTRTTLSKYREKVQQQKP